MKSICTSFIAGIVISAGVYAQNYADIQPWQRSNEPVNYANPHALPHPSVLAPANTDKYAGGIPYRIIGYEYQSYNSAEHRFYRQDSLGYEWYANEGSTDPDFYYFNNYDQEKVKQHWDYYVDGNQYILGDFYVKTFNNNGRITRLDGYNEVTPGQFELAYYTLFTYNNNGRLTQQDMISGVTQDSLVRLKFIYTQSKLTQLIYQSYSGGFTNIYTVTYEYAGNGEVSTSILSYWDNVNMDWDSSSKTAYTYTLTNKMDTRMNYYFNMGNFENSDSTKYYYNTNDDVDSLYIYSWDTGIMDWENSVRELRFYDPIYHNQTGYEYYTWDDINTEWDKGDKEVYQYNVNNDQVLFWDYDASGNNWVNNERIEYTVGALGERLTGLQTEYDGADWDTTYLYRWQWQYDVVGLETNQLPEAGIFPNPFADQVIFKYTAPAAGDFTISIYDLNGREIFVRKTYEAEGTNAFVWDGRDASGNLIKPGVYIYRMVSNGKLTTGKIIKS